MKRILIAGMTTMVLGSVIAVSAQAEMLRLVAAAEPAPATKTMGLRLAPGTGLVETVSEEVGVSAAIPGRIRALRHEPGRTVAKGQILAILENDAAFRESNVAETLLSEKRAVLSNAAMTGNATGVAAAERQVARAYARVEKARAYWENHFLRAPVSGVIQRFDAAPGDTVTGSRANPVITLAATRTPAVRMEVPEALTRFVRPGQRAFVTASRHPGQKFWGNVIRAGANQSTIELEAGTPLEAGTKVEVFVVQ